MTTLVFGATGGIGQAVCEGLTGPLLLAARGEERLKTLATRLNAPFQVVDVTQPGAIDACFAQAGPVTGVALCVGSILLKPAHLTTDAEWQHTLALNLTPAFEVIRAAGKYMKQGGSVVLVSTAAARVGIANHEAIAAAKAGVIGLTLSAAATYASRNLRVNCVAPGLIETPLSAAITQNPTAKQASEKMHALGRLGQPQEVASAIIWLLNQSWVTGQIIGVDGGLATVKSR
jgi:3-oxoacyl-[acyl-carrier protein] reductase